MSSSNQVFSSRFTMPVSIFQYPATNGSLSGLPRLEHGGIEPDSQLPDEPEEIRLGITLTEEALTNRIALARAEAVCQTEQRLRQEYDARVAAEAEKVAAAIRGFEQERSDYFARVELEIVHLALSIAGKILHREAQVDPMLMAALVRVALGQMKDGSAVSVRVRPEEAKRWRDYFAAGTQNLSISVVEDAELEPRACVLETDLGSANLSLDAQLKEVEQGFFDVLAQRR